MFKNKLMLIFFLSIFLTNIFHIVLVIGLSSDSSNQFTEVHQQESFRIQGIDHAIYNVSSSYQVIVHQNEPVRTGSDNGIMLMIYEFLNNGSKAPVVNLEQNLSASVIKDNKVLSVENLNPSTTTPGTYMIPFKPSKTGAYYLGLTGILGSSIINETFRLEDVSSVSDNLLLFVVLPLGLITVGSVGAITYLKTRKK